MVVLENQDTPAMNPKTTPILLLDLWEHAYYLDVRPKKKRESARRASRNSTGI